MNIFLILTAAKYCCILHGRVCVMASFVTKLNLDILSLGPCPLNNVNTSMQFTSTSMGVYLYWLIFWLTHAYFDYDKHGSTGRVK